MQISWLKRFTWLQTTSWSSWEPQEVSWLAFMAAEQRFNDLSNKWYSSPSFDKTWIQHFTEGEMWFISLQELFFPSLIKTTEHWRTLTHETHDFSTQWLWSKCYDDIQQSERTVVTFLYKKEKPGFILHSFGHHSYQVWKHFTHFLHCWALAIWAKPVAGGSCRTMWNFHFQMIDFDICGSCGYNESLQRSPCPDLSTEADE